MSQIGNYKEYMNESSNHKTIMNKLKSIWLKWLLSVEIQFYYIIEDLDNHETIIDGVFEIPFEKQDNETIIKFHINGIELPSNNNSIEITL